MAGNEKTEILLVLHNIEDRLKEIAEILKVGHKAAIETTQRQVLAGSSLRRKIYNLCDGKHAVRDIARLLEKSIQQVSNNIAVLQNASLIKEVRRGKEKYYTKAR
jgi:DNA-binding transcriptional ArsR family regulator